METDKPPRRVLGKGLKALLSEGPPVSPPEPPAAQSAVAVDELEPNRYQPRGEMAQEHLIELAESIRQKGLLQPIAVRRHGDRFEIIAGERRWRAARLAGLSHVPVSIIDASDTDMLILALVENIQREDLNPIEEAKAYKRLIDEFGLTQEELAASVGKDRATVANVLRLLQLPDQVQQCVANDTLSLGHAKVLLSLKEPKTQILGCRIFIEKDFSVREAEKWVQVVTGNAGKQRSRSKDNARLEPQLAMMGEEMQRRLGTKVRIKPKGESGTIEIEYYSQDDLDRITQVIWGKMR